MPVEVQVHLAPGQNAFNVVGLPDKLVAESRERVRAALSAIGLAPPYDRITPPADLAGRDGVTDKDIATALVWRGHACGTKSKCSPDHKRQSPPY